MFGLVAEMVMVIVGLISAFAKKVFCWWDYSVSNCVADQASCFAFFKILFSIHFIAIKTFTSMSFVIFLSVNTAISNTMSLYKNMIRFLGYLFAIICLGILVDFFLDAIFAPTRQIIRSASVFVKFRERFDFIALGTDFRYYLLSHNQLLNSWLRLEPVSGYIPVSGSHYCMRDTGECQC
jgi:hypothetical protein